MQVRTANAARKPIVVIIDDDMAVLHALEFSLGVEGFAVSIFRTAGGALAAPGPWPAPGCLVIDQNLPDMEGMELFGRLRSRGVTIPAILITTNPSHVLRRRAAESGVGIVEKPLLGSGLADAIRLAIDGSPAT